MIPQQQRSLAWLKWRRDKVTATDANVIMNKNAYKSIGELLDEKLGIRAPDEENEAMARGNALEDEARTAFELETGYMMFPQVCIHASIPWMVASLDGLTIEKDAAVEIKCPGVKVASKTFDTNTIPEYYIPQLQHQMAVTGLKAIHYFSYCPDDRYTTTLACFRDDAYIEKLIEREKKFYDILIKSMCKIEDYENDLDLLKDELYKTLEPL